MIGLIKKRGRKICFSLSPNLMSVSTSQLSIIVSKYAYFVSNVFEYDILFAFLLGCYFVCLLSEIKDFVSYLLLAYKLALSRCRQIDIFVHTHAQLHTHRQRHLKLIKMNIFLYLERVFFACTMCFSRPPRFCTFFSLYLICFYCVLMFPVSSFLLSFQPSRLILDDSNEQSHRICMAVGKRLYKFRISFDCFYPV